MKDEDNSFLAGYVAYRLVRQQEEDDMNSPHNNSGGSFNWNIELVIWIILLLLVFTCL